MSMTQAVRCTRALAVLTIGAGLAHLPVTQEHLREAPYVGISFAAFAAVAAALGGYLLARPLNRRAIDVAGALCGLAVVTYVATRVMAFPQIGDDVGNWLEPWGVVSFAFETAAVVVAVVSRRGVAAVSRPAPALPAEASAVWKGGGA
jgi:hypothetical protein